MPASATLLSVTEIAALIAARRKTTCAYTTVWSAAKRLEDAGKLTPEHTTKKGYKFYTPEQAKLIEGEMKTVISRKQPPGSTGSKPPPLPCPAKQPPTPEHTAR